MSNGIDNRFGLQPRDLRRDGELLPPAVELSLPYSHTDSPQRITEHRADIRLAVLTASMMERVGQALIDASEYLEEWFRSIRLVEYVLGILGALGTLLLIVGAQLDSILQTAAYVAGFLAAATLFITRLYFASLGKRRPELMLVFAFNLNQSASDLRVTMAQPYDETVRALLRSQLVSASLTLNVVRTQLPFVKRLIEASSEDERRQILGGLRSPDS
jgi:hypothetical protein